MQLDVAQILVVTSHAEAIDLAPHFPSVVSLVDTTHPNLENHPNRCVRPFDDTLDGLDGTPVAPDDVRAVVSFCASAPAPILVHCELGQSRAPAVALGLLAARGYPPGLATELLLAAHPPHRPFTPNVLVLAVFDDVLRLDGALLREAARWRLA